jgi:hypothetical protein
MGSNLCAHAGEQLDIGVACQKCGHITRAQIDVLWPEPIPASQPPETTGFYLAYAPRPLWFEPVWQLASYALRISDSSRVWVCDDSSNELKVTHWLPLPPNPG